jgi:hypothetical protein
MTHTRQTEDLDRLYFCNVCGKSFLFRSDKEDHVESIGHSRFTVFTIEGKLLKEPDDLI